ncbi:hypothetical protein, partial [Streptomyces brasiliscabiei]|uniref:hypothetical protein n=1 Tax=Streptomyces brasiliscabiei TaxID=2736302 RepID=UPI003014DF9B
KRKEELLVERLYQDSVVNHINVTPDMRRQFFKDHEREFMSLARARYARFIEPGKSEAEIMVARLRGGEKAEDIVRAANESGDDS